MSPTELCDENREPIELKSMLRLPHLFKAGKIFALGTLISIILVGGYLGLLQLGGNIHVVQAGVLYRSAQLDRDNFEALIRTDHIRSILNLRGADPNSTWYRQEMAAVRATRVKHFNYGIGATSAVSAKQIEQILQILRSAPKPLLIHCASGADRSGLVAALYVAEIEGKPTAEAARQLSIIFGHFPYFGSRTNAMDRSFWKFVATHHSTVKKQTARNR